MPMWDFSGCLLAGTTSGVATGSFDFIAVLRAAEALPKIREKYHPHHTLPHPYPPDSFNLDAPCLYPRGLLQLQFEYAFEGSTPSHPQLYMTSPHGLSPEQCSTQELLLARAHIEDAPGLLSTGYFYQIQAEPQASYSNIQASGLKF
ncbi:hypothetical protein BD779DRAFT_1785364 [Infundibulicybe gibba]|nr:hypothetical protein BD779DRAFT_1785364 [Infundibulicybe gibba]